MYVSEYVFPFVRYYFCVDFVRNHEIIYNYSDPLLSQTFTSFCTLYMIIINFFHISLKQVVFTIASQNVCQVSPYSFPIDCVFVFTNLMIVQSIEVIKSSFSLPTYNSVIYIQYTLVHQFLHMIVLSYLNSFIHSFVRVVS